MPPSDLLTGLAALVLTLFLFTYLIADNPLYRIATHLFIGITAGYVTLLAWYSVIQPQVFVPLLTKQFPEIVDFYLPPEGCSYRLAVVSMNSIS